MIKLIKNIIKKITKTSEPNVLPMPMSVGIKYSNFDWKCVGNRASYVGEGSDTIVILTVTYQGKVKS